MKISRGKIALVGGAAAAAIIVLGVLPFAFSSPSNHGDCTGSILTDFRCHVAHVEPSGS